MTSIWIIQITYTICMAYHGKCANPESSVFNIYLQSALENEHCPLHVIKQMFHNVTVCLCDSMQSLTTFEVDRIMNLICEFVYAV